MERGLHRVRRMSSFTLLAIAGVSLGLVACAPYSPGSFRVPGRDFSGERLTLDCLDLAVAGDRDLVAAGPIVDYQFGNRCQHPITVDLGAIRATGRTPTGEEVALVPYDPQGQIRAVTLETRTAGRERLEYRKARDFGIDLVQVCVALDGVAGASTGVVCFATNTRTVAVAQ